MIAHNRIEEQEPLLEWPVTARRVKRSGDIVITPRHRSIENIEAHLAHTGTDVWLNSRTGRVHLDSVLLDLHGPISEIALIRVRLHAYLLGLLVTKGFHRDVLLNQARHNVRDVEE